MDKEAAMPAKKLITKEKILQAALKLLKEEGYEAVNIKRLASELTCSTQPVYLSFTGMDQLREELVPLAVKELEEALKENRKEGVVHLYGREYILFAKKEQKLFCFLFMRANAFEEIKKMISPMIEEAISELMEAYRISHEEADVLHDHLWMHAHGIASMIAADFCDWDMEKACRMLEECKAVFTKKYEV